MTAARRHQLLADALATVAPRPGRPRSADLLIERVDEVESTSTDLLNRRRLVEPPGDHRLVDPASNASVAGLPPGLIDEGGAPIRPERIGAVWLIAAHQTGGRGRRGRQWRSDPQASLAASLAIEAALPADPGALTLVAGAAIARTLRAFGAQPWLKWPNDLYLRADDGSWTKAGGILCESRILSHPAPAPVPASLPGADRPTWRLVVGCGLNLFPAPLRAGDPAALARSGPVIEGSSSVIAGPPPVIAGSPPVVAGPPPGHLFGHPDPDLRDRLEEALGLALATALHAALRDGPASGLATWAEFDLLAGQAVMIHGADGVSQAVARGIDASGRLRVVDPADPSRCRALVAEEVSIRRLPG